MMMSDHKSRWPQPKRHEPTGRREPVRDPMPRIGHRVEPVVERLRKEHAMFTTHYPDWSLTEQ
jgi:hypothetical protein